MEYNIHNPEEKLLDDQSPTNKSNKILLQNVKPKINNSLLVLSVSYYLI